MERVIVDLRDAETVDRVGAGIEAWLTSNRGAKARDELLGERPVVSLHSLAAAALAALDPHGEAQAS